MSTFKKADMYQLELNKQRPFEGHFLEQIKDYYRVGLTWTSNALEGNSLTEIETKVLLEDGLTVGGKPLRDTFEAVGHAQAYDYMFTLLREPRLTVEDIRTLHDLFYRSIDAEHAGVWRDVNVIVTGSDYAFPEPKDLGRLMEELGQWMQTERDTMHPIRFAALLHLKFVTIHPFTDGNGRVARLLMNTALIQSSYMLAVVPPILRTDYLGAIRRYQQTGDAEPFIQFIAERVIETQKDMMRLMHIPMPKLDAPER